MQLYKDGSLQGKGVNCIPIFERPAYLKGDIPGDMVRTLPTTPRSAVSSMQATSSGA